MSTTTTGDDPGEIQRLLAAISEIGRCCTCRLG